MLRKINKFQETSNLHQWLPFVAMKPLSNEFMLSLKYDRSLEAGRYDKESFEEWLHFCFYFFVYKMHLPLEHDMRFLFHCHSICIILIVKRSIKVHTTIVEWTNLKLSTKFTCFTISNSSVHISLV